VKTCSRFVAGAFVSALMLFLTASDAAAYGGYTASRIRAS